MTTTIFEAKPYDPVKERRRRLLIIGIITVLLVGVFLAWWFRYLPYERRVDRFFDALQQKQYETAYGIWMNDPNWKQHPQNFKQYPFGEFYIDWGPGGEWGLINSHHVDGAAAPSHGSGVVVVTTVNERSEKARIWVEKSDKTMHFSPY
jgi:hypothetical protein